VAIIFSRRKINIESINVSPTEVKDISRFTIVVNTSRETVEKVVKQIQKTVDVLGAFVYGMGETYHQELALFKVPTKPFLGSNIMEQLVRDNNARILVIESDWIVIEKTGHKNEIIKLYEDLEPFGMLEFVRSARIAISKSKRKTSTFIKQLESSKTNKIEKY
jgi:acetolactate synthase-1/3 small subunit